LLVLLAGCLKVPSTSTSASAPSTLALHGQVVDAQGQPASGVQVYIENSQTAEATTDTSGAYSLLLGQDRLVQLAGRSVGGQGIHLYFEQTGQTGQTGQAAVAGPVSLTTRGEQAVDSVTLQAPASVEGTVYVLADGRQAEPGANVTVQMGRSQATSDQDGHFKLSGVPAGALTLTAAAPDSVSAVQDLTLKAGEAHVLDGPVMLLPDKGVTGAVLVDQSTDIASLVAAGHPYMRRFRVYGTKAAKYVRFFHDQTLFQAGKPSPLLPWRDIPTQFDYDFPTDGGNVLFYQFADENQNVLSPVESLAVTLDQFGATKGLVIEDGSGRVTRRDAVLNLDPPPTAFRMRVAESTVALAIQPWLPVAPTYDYTFALVPDITTGLFMGYGSRTVYLQYQDAMGVPSPVYSATAVLDLFPSDPNSVFVIEGGAPVTPNRLVRLDLQVPVNAYDMRVFDDDTNINGSGGLFSVGGPGGGPTDGRTLWFPAQPVFFHTFASSGLKTVYVQFRTRDQLVSPVYQQVIRVDPFPPAGVGFQINGGAPTSLTRALAITLVPPVTATAFKIFEDPNQSTTPGSGSLTGGSSGGFFGGGSNFNSNWINLTPNFTYIAEGTGTRTIYVQYKTLDGDVSDAFAQTVTIDPDPPGTIDFQIDNNALSTLDPVLILTLAAPLPPNVDAVMIGDGVPPDPRLTGESWLDLTAATSFTVHGTGPHTIYMMFRTTDGGQTPAVQRTIFYEPFPNGLESIQISGGATETTDLQVPITLTATPNVTQMKIANAPEDLAAAPLLPFTATYEQTIADTVGLHKIYAQYFTQTGEASPVYFTEITKK